MTILIFFAEFAPSPLAADLVRQGHIVHEALAISEVLALAEQHPEAQIVIAADVEPERARVIQQRYPTMQLEPGATAQDIVWELSLFKKSASVQ